MIINLYLIMSSFYLIKYKYKIVWVRISFKFEIVLLKIINVLKNNINYILRSYLIVWDGSLTYIIILIT
jgi:hypothetical protein